MKTSVIFARVALISAVTLLPLRAQTVANPDEPAAVVVYPYIVVDTAARKDTLIQLTNTSNQPVEARCFYENFTPQCSSGEPDATCQTDPPTCSGLCIPRNLRIPLRVRLTAMQPLAWQASSGLSPLPLTDASMGNGMTNLFTKVEGLGAGPFIGTLRCTAVDDDPLHPSRRNVLLGQATIEQFNGPPNASADAAQYRAVGVKALDDGTNRDEFLAFGGPGAEYESCPTNANLNHFFDGAVLHAGDSTSTVTTTLAIANCSGTPPVPAGNTVQFLVYNEFDQRFSTSRRVSGQLVTEISHIDTRSSPNSIFSVDVTGTLSGHSRLHGLNSGVHAIAIESHSSGEDSAVVHSDAVNAHGFGSRLQGDVLSYRPPRCIGDCDFDGNVSVDEAIVGVNIALDAQVAAACPPIDANGDAEVTVDEIIAAILAAADGCPEPVAPTPGEGPAPEPIPAPPIGAGPDITHFGLATADDHALQPDRTDDAGRPVFMRPYGQGMTMVVEARPGQSARPVATSTYDQSGRLPDLQMLVSRPLGDGNAAVCENDGLAGGVPAVPNLDFTTDSATVAAVNDLGCRAYDRTAAPPPNACTRIDGEGLGFGFVSPVSTAQFCIPIAKAWKFPAGDTIVAVRVRDQDGNLSAVREIVVHVEH